MLLSFVSDLIWIYIYALLLVLHLTLPTHSKLPHDLYICVFAQHSCSPCLWVFLYLYSQTKSVYSQQYFRVLSQSCIYYRSCSYYTLPSLKVLLLNFFWTSKNVFVVVSLNPSSSYSTLSTLEEASFRFLTLSSMRLRSSTPACFQILLWDSIT